MEYGVPLVNVNELVFLPLKTALRDTVQELQRLRQELQAGRAGVNHEFLARAKAREEAHRGEA